VNLYRNVDARPEQQQFIAVLREKCAFKNIGLPQFVDIEPQRANVEAGWSGMLAHQLPALLPVASFWSALPEIFGWLQGHNVEPVLPSMPLLVRAKQSFGSVLSSFPPDRVVSLS